MAAVIIAPIIVCHFCKSNFNQSNKNITQQALMDLNQYLQTVRNYNTEIVKFSATTIEK